jgi:hypothetical protein
MSSPLPPTRVNESRTRKTELELSLLALAVLEQYIRQELQGLEQERTRLEQEITSLDSHKDALAVEEPQPAQCEICDMLGNGTLCCGRSSCTCEIYGGRCFRCDQGFHECECKCGKCHEQRPSCTCTCGCPEKIRINETRLFVD